MPPGGTSTWALRPPPESSLLPDPRKTLLVNFYQQLLEASDLDADRDLGIALSKYPGKTREVAQIAAQQALLFLAPETGGDYGSLRAAVRGKPGIFVRASQDLNQASLDRSRLDQYMKEVRESAGLDAKELHEEGIELHPLPTLPDERN